MQRCCVCHPGVIARLSLAERAPSSLPSKKRKRLACVFLLSSVPFGAAGEPSHAANGIAISKHRIIVNIHRVRIFIFLSSRKSVYANAYSGVCVKFCRFYQFCLQIVSFRQQRLALTVTPVCLVAE